MAFSSMLYVEVSSAEVNCYAQRFPRASRGTEIPATNQKSERLLAVHCLHAVGIAVMNDTAICPLSLSLL